MKTVKRLFMKCRETGQSALQDWRNTPSEGIGTSPSQRFLGRHCKTLPISGSLLKPRYPVKEDAQGLSNQKEHQQFYYDQHVKPLTVGEAVRVRLPGKNLESGYLFVYGWTEVTAGEQVLTQNRRHLIQSGVRPELESQESEVELPTQGRIQGGSLGAEGDVVKNFARDKYI